MLDRVSRADPDATRLTGGWIDRLKRRSQGLHLRQQLGVRDRLAIADDGYGVRITRDTALEIVDGMQTLAPRMEAG
jgi:hypothetical protein